MFHLKEKKAQGDGNPPEASFNLDNITSLYVGAKKYL